MGPTEIQAPRGRRKLSARAKNDLAELARIDAEPLGPLPEVYSKQPIYYITNRFSVRGTNTVKWPRYSQVMDYELEFGVITKNRGANIPPSRAKDHFIGSGTVGNGVVLNWGGTSNTATSWNWRSSGLEYFAIPSSVSRPAEPTFFPYQTRVTTRSYDLARRIYMEGRDRVVLDTALEDEAVRNKFVQCPPKLRDRKQLVFWCSLELRELCPF